MVRILVSIGLFFFFSLRIVAVSSDDKGVVSAKPVVLPKASASKVNAKPVAVAMVDPHDAQPRERLCSEFNRVIKKYYWGRIICNPKTWRDEARFQTAGGRPLLYQVFQHGTAATTTVIMCGVHGDELSSVYLCIQLVRDILFDHKERYRNQRIVIAPLVNPDGFFNSPPTRTNGRGVDVNRNFPTNDFAKDALVQWRKKYKKDKRRFPGNKAGSEVETQFQMMLIERFKPDKIVSVHAPLGFLDFDVPPVANNSEFFKGFSYAVLSNKSASLAREMSRKANNYPIMNFRIYPGSLGNYAGHERKTPVFTLELPTAASHMAYKYWLRVGKSIASAIQYQM